MPTAPKLKWLLVAINLLVYFLVLFAAPLLILSILLTYNSLHDEHQKEYTANCPAIIGNPDMYGIGVRVATYLQLVLTILVEFRPKMAVCLAPVNMWFLVAFFAALCTILWTRDSDPIEPYVIISLGNGISGMVLGGFWHPSIVGGYENHITQASRYIVVAIWKVASTVFWWYILPLPMVDHTNPCGRFGWFVSRSTLNGNGFGLGMNRAFNILGWLALVILFYPVLFTISIIAYIVIWKLDLDALPPITKTTTSQQCTIHRPTKLGIMTDFTCRFPVGDLKYVVYGVSVFDNPPYTQPHDSDQSDKAIHFS